MSKKPRLFLKNSTSPFLVYFWTYLMLNKAWEILTLLRCIFHYFIFVFAGQILKMKMLYFQKTPQVLLRISHIRGGNILQYTARLWPTHCSWHFQGLDFSFTSLYVHHRIFTIWCLKGFWERPSTSLITILLVSSFWYCVWQVLRVFKFSFLRFQEGCWTGFQKISVRWMTSYLSLSMITVG